MGDILVPTDFSKNAENALQYAVELAKLSGAKIILLNVFRPSFIRTLFRGKTLNGNAEYAEHKSMALLKALYTDILQAEKVTYEYRSVCGNMVDTILQTIEKNKIEIVVMGTDGANRIQEIFKGNNTIKIIERARCFVIAVPGYTQYHGIKKIIYATDYHLSDIVALKSVIEMARLFHADMKVIHVCDGEYRLSSEKEELKEFEEKIKRRIHYPAISFQLVHSSNVGKKLAKIATGKAADMLIMSTRPRNILDKVLRRGLTSKIAFRSKVPLMTFHYSEESTLVG